MKPSTSHARQLTHCAVFDLQILSALRNNCTKGAIEQMTRILAKDLASKGINVNAVAPGPTATELFLKGKSEQILKAITSNIPFGRLSESDEIASATGFLCSTASKWVTGQVLRVNGGMAL